MDDAHKVIENMSSCIWSYWVNDWSSLTIFRFCNCRDYADSTEMIDAYVHKVHECVISYLLESDDCLLNKIIFLHTAVSLSILDVLHIKCFRFYSPYHVLHHVDR